MYVGSVWVCIQEETRVQKSRGTGRSTCLVCMCTLHVHAHRFARERRGPGGRRGRTVSFFYLYIISFIFVKETLRPGITAYAAYAGSHVTSHGPIAPNTDQRKTETSEERSPSGSPHRVVHRSDVRMPCWIGCSPPVRAPGRGGHHTNERALGYTYAHGYSRRLIHAS